jgi:hypothetical protein
MLKKLLGGNDFVAVDNSQRFNFMLQQMQNNRWKITLIILMTFFFIIFGIVLSVMLKASIQESWKEMLLILLGAFVGNLNKVIDFWFSNEDRDKLLVQKMDEEDDFDGAPKYNILEKSGEKKNRVTETPEIPETVESVEESGMEHLSEEEVPSEEISDSDEEPLADDLPYPKNRYDDEEEQN